MNEDPIGPVEITEWKPPPVTRKPDQGGMRYGEANPQAYQHSGLAGSSVEEDYEGRKDRLFNDRGPNLAIMHEKPEHRIAVLYKAQGKTNREIAKVLGWTEAWTSQVLRQPWAREALLEEIRRNNGGEEVSAILRGEAVNTVFTLIDLRDTADDEGVRLRASQDLLDRHLGKATQRVETKNESWHISGNIQDIDRKLAALQAEEQRLLGVGTVGESQDAKSIPEDETKVS